MVAPGDPGRLFALVKDSAGPLWGFPATNVRLMISDDFAATWSPFPGGLPVPANCVVNVNLDYAASDALYTSTCQGLYTWDAGKAAWSKRSDRLTDAVAIAYGQPNKVWAAAHGDGIIRSTDGGKTWQDASTGLTTFGGMANLGFDPRDNSTLYGIIRPKYAGSYLRRGTADGHWQTMPTPLDNVTIETGMTVDGGGRRALRDDPGRAGRALAVTQSEHRQREGCQVGTGSRLRAGSAGQPAGLGVGARWACDLCQHLAFDAAH